MINYFSVNRQNYVNVGHYPIPADYSIEREVLDTSDGNLKIWLDSVPILPQTTQGASYSNKELSNEEDCAGGDAASVASIAIEKISGHHRLPHTVSQKFFEEDLPQKDEMGDEEMVAENEETPETP